jgi:DNA-binding beta-propeller fold protein YncE
MDELSLRALLERAISPEPPLGHLVGNSLRAGRKLRQRRRATGAAALSAAAIVAVSAVPVLASGAGPKASKPGPAALAMPPADARTAYVATGTDTVVPISLATNTAGTPIKVPVGMITGSVTFAAAAAPNGRVVYEVGTIRGRGAAVTPIDTATNTAGPAITLGNAAPTNIAVAPNGKTAYVAAEQDIFPINTTTNTARRLIRIPTRSWAMAFTPDGKTLYVLNPDGHGRYKPDVVTPIRTATDRALRPIQLPVAQKPLSYLFDIKITPNGKTAYVVYGVEEGKPYANSLIPINLATNRALAPIPIEASGLASGLVITPGGRTAYVLSSRAVTPIDTATNHAEPAINLPATAGYAYSIALAPNGKTIYVLTPRGVVPIRTASRSVLPMIKVPKLCNFTQLAITPDSRTIYVGGCTTRIRRWHGHKYPQVVGGGVVPISTATNTAGQFINLGDPAVAITFAG